MHVRRAGTNEPRRAKAMIGEDILQKFPDLFGTKKVNGRDVDVEQTIAALTRERGDGLFDIDIPAVHLLGSEEVWELLENVLADHGLGPPRFVRTSTPDVHAK